MERRRTAEVVATDIPDSGEQDVPAARRPAASRPRGETFHIAAGLLGSKAVYRQRNVYDLDPRPRTACLSGTHSAQSRDGQARSSHVR